MEEGSSMFDHLDENFGQDIDHDLMRYLDMDAGEGAARLDIEGYDLSEDGSVKSEYSSHTSPFEVKHESPGGWPGADAGAMNMADYTGMSPFTPQTPQSVPEFMNMASILPPAGSERLHLSQPPQASLQSQALQRNQVSHQAQQQQQPQQQQPQQQQPQQQQTLSWKPTAEFNDAYHKSQLLLQEAQFGRTEESPAVPPLATHFSDEYAHIVNAGPGPHPYKYQLYLGELPHRSRVETQITCSILLSPPPDEHLLHLPTDTIARPRFQLRDNYVPHPQVLSLEVDAVVQSEPQSEPQKPIFMCSKCISREKKRAFRKKTLDQNEEHHWNENKSRSLVIFNCRELVTIPLPKRVELPSGEVAEGREIELPLRLACYCRHHAAKDGYKLVVTVRDWQNNIVARAVSDTIFITDNHKEPRPTGSTAGSAAGSATGSAATSATASAATSAAPSAATSATASTVTTPAGTAGNTPTSTVPSRASTVAPPESPVQSMYAIDSGSDYNTSASAHSSSVSRGGGRRSSAYHPYARPGRFSSRRSSSISSSGMSPVSPGPTPPAPMQGIGLAASAMHQPPATTGAAGSSGSASGGAVVQRAIPNQGSVRGGIEITLLGQGFHPGLVAMFGDVPAISTQCWSDTTVIAHLPPSNVAGMVPVSFQGHEPTPQSAMFTYINDSGSKLVELALQVVGFKLSGKVEDPNEIANRIVKSDGTFDGRGLGEGTAGDAPQDDGSAGSTRALAQSFTSQDPEKIALRCLEYVRVMSGRFVNVNIRNTEGQTMMHLASILGFYEVVVALLAQGAHVDMQDVSGMSPLHFAAMFGQRAVTRQLLAAHADPFHRNCLGKTVIEAADSTVADLLPADQRSYYMELNSRTSSSSTLASIMSREDLLPHFAANHDDSLDLSSPPPDGFSDTDDDSDDDFLASVRRLHLEQKKRPLSSRRQRTLMRYLQGMWRAVREPATGRTSARSSTSTSSDRAASDRPDSDRPDSDRPASSDSWTSNSSSRTTTSWTSGSGGSSSRFGTPVSRFVTPDARLASPDSERSSVEPDAFAARGQLQPFTSASTVDEDSALREFPRVGKSPLREYREYRAPPRYCDIYPQANEKYRSEVIEIALSDSDGDGDSDDGELPPSDEQVFRSWQQSPLKQVRNDRMLFTFWLPLTVIALCYLAARVVPWRSLGLSPPVLPAATPSWPDWSPQRVAAAARALRN